MGGDRSVSAWFRQATQNHVNSVESESCSTWHILWQLALDLNVREVFKHTLSAVIRFCFHKAIVFIKSWLKRKEQVSYMPSSCCYLILSSGMDSG